MDLWHSSPFAIYALFTVALCVMVTLIDLSAGGVRAKTKTTLNPEDAGSTSKGATVVDSDVEQVARVMRAHRNALANVTPFLFVMFLFVALGATSTWVTALCGVFAAARVLHAVVYLKGVQPWRTVFFSVGLLCTVVASVHVVRAAVALL